MALFTQKSARTIANKLGNIQKKKRHDQAVVRYQGRIVAKFGISRASKEKGHDYIPEQLYISNDEASALAQCSLDSEGYFAILNEKGLLSDNY